MPGKLTTTQREALSKIVAYQRQAGRELVFTHVPAGGGGVKVQDADERNVVEVPIEYLGLWHECGFIFFYKATRFILRQEALEEFHGGEAETSPG